MNNLATKWLEDEAQTLLFAQKMAEKIVLKNGDPFILFLKGDLGAGKTTFVRGLLQGLGYQDIVKSPTYTLIEFYELEKPDPFVFLHLDLYRLNHPQEFRALGLEDYLDLKTPTLICIEWPEKGAGYVPAADMELTFIQKTVGSVVGRELQGLFCSTRATMLFSKSFS